MQGGFIKEDVGVVGHQCLPDTTFALLWKTSKSQVLTGKQLTAKEVRSSERF